VDAADIADEGARLLAFATPASTAAAADHPDIRCTAALRRVMRSSRNVFV
jgi:hypothetical protein